MRLGEVDEPDTRLDCGGRVLVVHEEQRRADGLHAMEELTCAEHVVDNLEPLHEGLAQRLAMLYEGAERLGDGLIALQLLRRDLRARRARRARWARWAWWGTVAHDCGSWCGFTRSRARARAAGEGR